MGKTDANPPMPEFATSYQLQEVDPAWLNWYLLALLFWRLTAPVWKRMKYPLWVAIAAYLFAGFSQISGDFSMDRFFGLLPFFVLGLILKPEHFELLNKLWVKIASVLLLLCAGAVALFIAPKAPLDPFYFKASYADMDLSWWMGPSVRVALLLASLAMCAAVMALIPRHETWYTDLGTRTLYAYLLHGIPVLIAKEMGWLSFPWMRGPLGALAITAGGVALAIVLCLPETRTIFKWVLEPRLTWLYRRPARLAERSAKPAAPAKAPEPEKTINPEKVETLVSVGAPAKSGSLIDSRAKD